MSCWYKRIANPQLSSHHFHVMYATALVHSRRSHAAAMHIIAGLPNAAIAQARFLQSVVGHPDILARLPATASAREGVQVAACERREVLGGLHALHGLQQHAAGHDALQCTFHRISTATLVPLQCTAQSKLSTGALRSAGLPNQAGHTRLRDVKTRVTGCKSAQQHYARTNSSRCRWKLASLRKHQEAGAGAMAELHAHACCSAATERPCQPNLGFWRGAALVSGHAASLCGPDSLARRGRPHISRACQCRHVCQSCARCRVAGFGAVRCSCSLARFLGAERRCIHPSACSIGELWRS